MKLKSVLAISIFLFFLSGCAKSSTSWAKTFVVWNGYVYEISDEYVKEVDKEIGKVTKYSDHEGTYNGNFSNKYKKGTKYYSIKGISTDVAIAIQEEDGRFRKAISDGKYGEK